MGQIWTETEDEILRRRVAEGRSAAEVAAELTGLDFGVTRSAVLGRAQRINLALGPGGGDRGPPTPEALGLRRDRDRERWARQIARRAQARAMARLERGDAKPRKKPVRMAYVPKGGAARKDPERARGANVGHPPAYSGPLIHTRDCFAPFYGPGGGGVSIAALRLTTCRWPHGDERTDDFAYCGEDVARGSYCAGHAALAYLPARARTVSGSNQQNRREP